MIQNVPRPVRPGQTALSDDRVSEDVLGQMRTAVNLTNRVRRTVTTAATGVATQIWLDKVAVPLVSMPRLRAVVTGRSFDGASFFSHEIMGQFFRGAAGAAAQLGATQELHPAIRSNVALVAALGVDADSFLFVTVNDGALATMKWEAWIEESRQ